MVKMIVILLMLVTLQAQAENNYNEATRKALEAAYIQTGVKDNVDQYARGLERRYVPVFVKQHGGWVMFLIQTFRDDKVWVVYKWEF